MIRVGFLTPSMHVGGAERFIISLAKNFFGEFEAAGCVLDGNFLDPRMVTECERYMPVVRPPQPINADVYISWGIQKLHHLTQYLDVPVVEVSHGDVLWDVQSEMLRQSCMGATHFVGVSTGAAKAFPRAIQDKVEVIPNGVEPQRCAPRNGRDWFRKQLNVSPGDKLAPRS